MSRPGVVDRASAGSDTAEVHGKKQECISRGKSTAKLALSCTRTGREARRRLRTGELPAGPKTGPEPHEKWSLA